MTEQQAQRVEQASAIEQAEQERVRTERAVAQKPAESAAPSETGAAGGPSASAPAAETAVAAAPAAVVAPMGAGPAPVAAVRHGGSQMPGYPPASPPARTTFDPPLGMGAGASSAPSSSPPPPGGGGAPTGPAGKLPPLRSAPSAGPSRWIAVLVAIVGVVAMAATLVPAIWSSSARSVGGTISSHASVAGIQDVSIVANGEDVTIGFGPVDEATLDVEARGVVPGTWELEARGSTLHVGLIDSLAGSPWGIGTDVGQGDRSVRLTLPFALQGAVGLDATSTAFASMRIGGDFGRVRLTAGDGELSFSGAATSVEAMAMSGGSLEIDAKVKEELVVTSATSDDVPWDWSDGGSVDFTGSAKKAQIDVGSGRASVRASIAETIAASATSGSLSIELAGAPPKVTTIALESGFATLSVPRGEYQVAVPVRTGTVDSEVPSTPSATSRIAGDVGSGELTIGYATP